MQLFVLVEEPSVFLIFSFEPDCIIFFTTSYDE